MIQPIVSGIMRPLFRPLFSGAAMAAPGDAQDDQLPAGTYLVIEQSYLVGSSGEFLVVG